MFATSRRLVPCLLGVLLMAAACSDATGPEEGGAAAVAGAWSGTIDHPAWTGGTLTVTLAQAGDVLSGEYRMRLVRGTQSGGRVQVQNYGGPAGGGLAGRTVSLVLTVDRSTWIGTARLAGAEMSGSFNLPNGATAPFTLSR